MSLQAWRELEAETQREADAEAKAKAKLEAWKEAQAEAQRVAEAEVRAKIEAWRKAEAQRAAESEKEAKIEAVRRDSEPQDDMDMELPWSTQSSRKSLQAWREAEAESRKEEEAAAKAKIEAWREVEAQRASQAEGEAAIEADQGDPEPNDEADLDLAWSRQSSRMSLQAWRESEAEAQRAAEAKAKAKIEAVASEPPPLAAPPLTPEHRRLSSMSTCTPSSNPKASFAFSAELIAYSAKAAKEPDFMADTDESIKGAAPPVPSAEASTEASAEDLQQTSGSRLLSAIDKQIAESLDLFFSGADIWQRVVDELRITTATPLSKNALKWTGQQQSYFRVQVPRPYPGVQCRRSKSVTDRHSTYAENGAIVCGQVEDDGEWLMVSDTVYLPMRVTNVQILVPLPPEAVKRLKAAHPVNAWCKCCRGSPTVEYESVTSQEWVYHRSDASAFKEFK